MIHLFRSSSTAQWAGAVVYSFVCEAEATGDIKLINILWYGRLRTASLFIGTGQNRVDKRLNILDVRPILTRSREFIAASSVPVMFGYFGFITLYAQVIIQAHTPIEHFV